MNESINSKQKLIINLNRELSQLALDYSAYLAILEF
jgi:hypothetical protein